MKLRPYMVYRGDGQITDLIAGYHHWCPACNEPHGIALKRAGRVGPSWSFNGDHELPTFYPSILCFTVEGNQRQTLCHYFITNGMIQFCSDNPHDLNGQTVTLPDWPSPDGQLQ